LGAKTKPKQLPWADLSGALIRIPDPKKQRAPHKERPLSVDRVLRY